MVQLQHSVGFCERSLSLSLKTADKRARRHSSLTKAPELRADRYKLQQSVGTSN